MSCDILVIAPHPDDAEIHLGATIAAQIRRGLRVAVIDCTRGESASRGSPEQRLREAEQAAEIWGLSARENLALPDGGLNAQDGEQRRCLVAAIRRHAPRWVLSICEHSRHPDHRAAHTLSRDACKCAAIHGYAAGIAAIAPPQLAFYEAELPLVPDLLMPANDADVAIKEACLDCYESQWGSTSGGPNIAIAQPAFRAWIRQRGAQWGYHAGAPYAEALIRYEPWVGDRIFDQ
ncbi:MAG: bacillithiol biosynthesis deacetylase BshB1 [Planctomycetota bacterium]|nr:MAG: bacillithiol biosynthesis deacetylase BshB1 [Planctomycetota bacterium]